MTTLEQVTHLVSSYLHEEVGADTLLMQDTYMDSMDIAELTCILEKHFELHHLHWRDWDKVITPSMTCRTIASFIDNQL